MFDNLKNRIEQGKMKAMADTRLGREFKSIFDIGGVPAYNQFYNYGIFVWKDLYKGVYTPWHIVPIYTLNGKQSRELYRMNIPKMICAEMAGIVWGDKCTIKVNRPGFEPTDEKPVDDLQLFVESVLDKNGFYTHMQDATEKALALGGEALKVWYEEPNERREGGIKIGYCNADQFIPTAWTNSTITEGVFISRIARGGYYYTRLEWHKWDGLTYVVQNDLYRSESQDILGFRYPLSSIYPQLNERTEINGLERSLFSYFRVPNANNIDDDSPLGCSIYANSLETLHGLDITYDSLIREFRLGKSRLIVPARSVKAFPDPVTGEMVRMFDLNDEAYEALATENADDLKPQMLSPSLRVNEHVDAINAQLKVLCDQIGFSSNALSFSQQNGIRTATEVISENSKTYKTVCNMQNAMIPALKQMVQNILDIAVLYDVDFNGVKITNEAEISVSFDDGIVQDRSTNINEGIQLTAAGLMSKKKFLTDTLHYTDAEAEAELKEIAEEQSIPAMTVDNLFGTTE